MMTVVADAHHRSQHIAQDSANCGWAGNPMFGDLQVWGLGLVMLRLRFRFSLLDKIHTIP